MPARSRLLAGAGLPLRAPLCARSRQRVDRYLLHSNAVQGIGLRSFGLPFAMIPPRGNVVPVRGHCLNPPAHIGPPLQRRASFCL